MLIFSTILDINDTLTKDKFIELAIEWNQNTPHANNIVPNLQWDGSRNVRFGSDELWLEISEYRNEDIIAIRYERVSEDGVVWDSDFVMNFNEMRMSIQLDRSYREDALVIDSDFSTPHFIRLLIDGEYIKDDAGLKVSGRPIYITERNISILTDVINETSYFRMPVVYVSKTIDDADPIDVRKIAGRLKGVAHVLVEGSRTLNNKLRTLCSDKNEYYGAVGVYYPNSSQPSKRYLYHREEGYDEVIYQKVLRDLIRYSTVQQLDKLYTWQGVNSAILHDRYIVQREERIAAEAEMKKARTEVDDVYEAFDSELQQLQQQVEMLIRANESLMYENQGLRAKLTETDRQPLLYYGEEIECYTDEIKEMVCAAIDNSLKTATKTNTRRYDVLSDIIRSNPVTCPVSDKKEKIKQMLKTYDGMSKTLRQELNDFGYTITEEGKHYKLTFFEDNRYATCLSKTPSDHREGKNAASEIIGKML